MAGYSATPLLKKLGIKASMVMYVEHAPDNYWDYLAPLPADVTITTKTGKPIQFAHIFVKERKSFEKLFRTVKKDITHDGMLWVSWPKKASRIATDLDENIIRDFGLAQGLVDVKVCAVDDVWSGLKFVYRLKDREGARSK
jgi:hypothetical protein